DLLQTCVQARRGDQAVTRVWFGSSRRSSSRGHAVEMVGFIYISRFEITEVLLRVCVYQRILHYEKCIVGRQREGVRGDAGARFDCISDGLPPVPQRVRKSEDRIRVSGVDRKGACDRIVQQYCGECNAIAAVPHSIQKRRIVPRQVKHTDDFVECSQVNCDRRKIRAASDQTCNLRRNRTVGGREITGCGLIAKPRSYSAAERLEPYLYRIVQAVVAGIISPKRNDIRIPN